MPVGLENQREEVVGVRGATQQELGPQREQFSTGWRNSRKSLLAILSRPRGRRRNALASPASQSASGTH
jgi:hypothetical protein